jgi:2-dehydropantoate 2-reductase
MRSIVRAQKFFAYYASVVFTHTTTMRILVVGAGATGGYFGARLAQAGRDVTFLVRAKRASELRANGLQIVSPLGDFTVAPSVMLANELRESFDVVLLTVKAYSLQSALEDIAPAVGPETMIMPVLNGMRHLDEIARRFSAHNVVGCACKVATYIDDAGRIVQLNTMQELVYGEMDGVITARIQELHRALDEAGFTARLSHTIEHEMWEKWVMLSALGALTCLMRGNIGEIMATQYGEQLALQLLQEVVDSVTALGHAPAAAFVIKLRARLTAKQSPWTSSMYRDLQAGYPVEADQILGDLISRAQSANVATPLLIAAFASLSVYQAGQSTTISARSNTPPSLDQSRS